MTQRHHDLRTADLATQRPADPTAPERPTDADVQDDRADDDVRREDPAADATPDGRIAGTASPSTTGPLLATQDAEGFRARWTDVQTGFVDAPRQAVERADALVAELMQQLASTFADERGRLERHWVRGDAVPTDNLRDAFQRYRSFFERLLAT